MHWRAPYESVLLQHSFGIDAGTNDVDNAADAVADGDDSEDMQEDWCHIASAGRPTTTSAAAACASDAAAAAAAAAVSSIDSGGRPMAAPAGTAAAGCSGQAATTDYAAAADAQTGCAPAARDIQPSHSKQGTSRRGRPPREGQKNTLPPHVLRLQEQYGHEIAQAKSLATSATLLCLTLCPACAHWCRPHFQPPGQSR